jgi:hypothetical protein
LASWTARLIEPASFDRPESTMESPEMLASIPESGTSFSI